MLEELSRWNMQKGVIIATSTASSNRMSSHYETLGTRVYEDGIEKPDFLMYEAYFYVDMYFDNVAGFSDKRCKQPSRKCLKVQKQPAPPRNSIKQIKEKYGK